eukprot:CAMPEP_0115532336 /NCGR_PEP_ID=MMETSP0271-20121206/85527_1 /TAXON_ID=71861 /ORGANISM="Scrippsiella trochoidea, Strain CCMP3099" /LENGTH=82 /DNA_ID=CAMNT_0002964631 /DNA_START=196 /DNA_END=441 /DNA_ORIENTATION=+
MLSAQPMLCPGDPLLALAKVLAASLGFSRQDFQPVMWPLMALRVWTSASAAGGHPMRAGSPFRLKELRLANVAADAAAVAAA